MSLSNEEINKKLFPLGALHRAMAAQASLPTARKSVPVTQSINDNQTNGNVMMDSSSNGGDITPIEMVNNMAAAIAHAKREQAVAAAAAAVVAAAENNSDNEVSPSVFHTL